MFQRGDKYIHFTKYGGVNKGEIQDFQEIHVLDTDNCCTYKKVSILTTKGISLCLDGSDGKIYKIESEIPKKRAKELGRTFKKLANHKHRPSDKYKIHNIDED